MSPLECPPLESSRRALLSWTTRFLREAGVKALDRWGQNFLIDPRGINLFLKALQGVQPYSILEVGPGTCILTSALYTATPRLLAVEIDAGLSRACRKVLESCMPAASIIRGDGVRMAGITYADTLVSNTPYNITTQIIIEAARNNSIKEMVLGMQLEVARRITASPGTADYGRISLITQRYFTTDLIGVIPRTYYYPQPKVDGAVVRLTRRTGWKPEDKVLEDAARCMFTGRRRLASKMARTCSKILGINLCTEGIGDKRVYQLSYEDLERMIKCG